MIAFVVYFVLFSLVRDGSAADLEPPTFYKWSNVSRNGCNSSNEGNVWNLACQLGASEVYSITYNKGAFCRKYSLTCSSALGRPSCYVFSNTTEARRFEYAGQLPSELGLKFDGGCTASTGSACTTSASYPDLEKTSPLVSLTKTMRTQDKIVNFSVGNVSESNPPHPIPPHPTLLQLPHPPI